MGRWFMELLEGSYDRGDRVVRRGYRLIGRARTSTGSWHNSHRLLGPWATSHQPSTRS